MAEAVAKARMARTWENCMLELCVGSCFQSKL